MSQGQEERHSPGIVVAVGDPERERRLLGALGDAGLAVAGRCLDGPSLVERTRASGVGAAIASTDLHRLTRDALLAVQEAGVPLILLVPTAEMRKFVGLANLVSAESTGPEVVEAIQEALRTGIVRDPSPAEEASSAGAPGGQGRADGCKVIALVSGKGAPGTTSVAIGLSGAIAATGKKVLLVDGDLRGGSVGPYLDLDPRRGLVGLTLGGGSEAPDLRNELQDAPGFSVLAGLERPEMRERLAVEQINAGLHSVGRGFGAVVIDAGEMVASTASPASVAFLRIADRVLVVTTADLMGLWNARACLRYLGELKGLRSEAISIVVNRHAGHEQHNAVEVERALGVPVLAVIPQDAGAARKARDEQEPFAARGGPSARELRALAQRLAQGALSVAEELPPKERGRWHWRRHPVEERR